MLLCSAETQIHKKCRKLGYTVASSVTRRLVFILYGTFKTPISQAMHGRLISSSWNKQPDKVYHKTFITELQCDIYFAFICANISRDHFHINNGACALIYNPLTAVIWRLLKMKPNVNICSGNPLKSQMTRHKNFSRASGETDTLNKRADVF